MRCHTGIVSAPEPELAIAWQRWVSRDTALLDRLLDRHREAHRHYHTAVHVRWVLRHVDTLAGTEPVGRRADLTAAAFYHDAIYDPKRADNEHASAELAQRDLMALGWADRDIAHVAAMIKATAHVGAPRGEAPRVPSHGDTAVLLDADLAVLGADPSAYSTYVAGVRREYAHVAADVWRAGRGAVLEGFLDRDEIFLTATGRQLWEAHARANLTAELASLR